MEPTVNRSLQRRFEIERNQKFNQMQRNQKGQRIHQKCDRFALKCVSFFFFAFYFGVPERKTVAIEKSLDDPPPPPPSDPPPTPLPTLRRHPQPTPWY